jgi:drug/metabolite transporter (DMT)-like permease
MAGLARTPAATASLLLNLELVATVVLAALVFREHIGGRLATGTALVVTASVALGWSATPEVRLGALLVAAACLCWGVDNCVTAGLDQLSPAQITFMKGLVAGGANLALGVAVSPWPAAGDVLVALAIGAAGYGASITLWVAGARDLGAARGQLVFATAPFLGAAVAWTAFSDPVTARQLVAVALAAVGVGCVLRSDHHHVHQHVPLEHDHEHIHDDGHHDHDHDDRQAIRSLHDVDDAVTRSLRRSAHRHRHRHQHDELEHAHPHVPDLHHHHDHPSTGREDPPR